jgi:sulfur relay (sulfurtransferase) complex TusBCD TusD component (DsrE family)
MGSKEKPRGAVPARGNRPLRICWASFKLVPMSLRGKKLGVLLSTHPDQPAFQQGLCLAEAALDEGVTVYLYCVDEAIHGIGRPRLQALAARGLKLYACAYAAQRRNLPVNDKAAFAGLAVLSDIIAATDRFVSFN